MLPVDQELLRECQEARLEIQAAEQRLSAAKSGFERAVRRLYVEGASTREIAAVLELSHQRVHQLVGAEPKAWWQRLFGLEQEPPRGCSFCGRSAKKVGKLVTGPSVLICDDCIDTAIRLLDTSNSASTAPFEHVAETSPKRCSFCGKRGRGNRRVTARGHQICVSCVGMAKAIAEETSP